MIPETRQGRARHGGKAVVAGTWWLERRVENDLQERKTEAASIVSDEPGYPRLTFVAGRIA